MTEPSSSRRPVLLAVLAVVGLAGVLVWANSRGGVSEDTAETQQSGSTAEGDGDQATGDASSSGTTVSRPAVDLPTDPITGELVYSCAGRRFAVDDLAEAIESDGSTEDELKDAGHSVDTLGDPAAWAVTSAGVAVAIEALPTEPPALVLAEPGAAPFPCVAIRAGGFEGRSVAWERVGDAVVVESCVATGELVVDEREIAGSTVLSVFAPVSDELEPVGGDGGCRLNGDVTLDVDTEAQLSSLTFPFVASNARTWALLGFGTDVAPLDAASLGLLECTATPDTTEVFVQWTSIAPGFDVTVVGDTQDLFTAERTAFDESAALLGAFVAAMDEIGATTDVGTPEGFVNGFSDFTAPLDGTRAYEVRVSGSGIEPITAGCGDAGLVPGGVTATTQPAAAQASGDLDSARILFQSRAVSPYGYLRAVPICDGCDSSAVELKLQPSGLTGVALDFDPPLATQGGADLARVMINPFLLHDTLLAAEAEGRDVTYRLDPTSGVPVEWTIDGEGARIECFEIDTAPPDLRVNDGCSTELDLIGG